jgi:hypothetical protein
VDDETVSWQAIRLARGNAATGTLGQYLMGPPLGTPYVGPPLVGVTGPCNSIEDALRAVMVRLEDDDVDL